MRTANWLEGFSTRLIHASTRRSRAFPRWRQIGMRCPAVPAMIEHLEPRKLLTAAVTPVGTETLINSSLTTGFQLNPAIASDAAGDYVVVWQAQNVPGGSSDDIVAQRYSAGGFLVGSQFLVNTFTTASQAYPQVAMNSIGDFVITWTSLDQAGASSQNDVYARRYNDVGAAQGSEFLVNTFTTGVQTSPAVAIDAAGDFTIAWASYNEAGPSSNSDVYARRYLSTGVSAGGEFLVNSTTTGGQDTPKVAMDYAGDFCVTWAGGVSDYNIYARRFNSAGVAQGSQFSVNTYTTNNQYNPVIAMDKAGEFAIAWGSANQAGAVSGGDIYARRFNSAGTALGNEFLVNSYTTHDQQAPSLAMDLQGDFVVTWESAFEVNVNSYNDIYGRLYNLQGVAQGSEFLVNTHTGSGQTVPAVAMDATGNFVVAWQSYNQAGGSSSYDIYAQRFMPTTSLVVNQAPVGTSKTTTAGLGVPYKLRAFDFGFTDPNNIPPNSLLAVKITLLPGSGTLKDNGVAVTLNQFVSAADIAADKLVFTPANNLSTGVYFLCKFQVEDNGGTAYGGVNLDPTAKVLDVKLVKVNHAPSGTNGTVTGKKNADYVFKVADFGLTDPNDNPPNALLSVKITLLPTAGVIYDNGININTNQFISAADISSGKLKFTPNAGLNAGTYFVFKFQVMDNGGSSNGGSNLDPTANVLDIKLT